MTCSKVERTQSYSTVGTSSQKSHISIYGSTCYLSADVGFGVLKDQSQIFDTVGLKETVKLWLAGEEKSRGEIHCWNEGVNFVASKEKPRNIFQEQSN